MKEVKSGTECGIGVKDYNDIKSGDQIEFIRELKLNALFNYEQNA